MIEMFSSRPTEIMAAVGPAIGKCCYEVDSPVVEVFRKSAIGLDCFDKEREPGKWRLDLVAANYRLLLAAGLTENNISISSRCVSCEHDLFFSYRRNNGDTGRQMGFIMLK